MDPIDVIELANTNIREYASSVNGSRAIPDARTGLKPIHQKILYEMWVDGISSDKKYNKCAKMVGQVIARFSEHGDSATYEALARLAQPWVHPYRLLDFHGNVGSQFGDGPASMRYTEAKLSKLAEDGYLATLDRDVVDWRMNYTNDEREPESLPAVFPGLFCLANQGMGYGCACYFLPFNLREVGEQIINRLYNRPLEPLQFDLPTGGTIIDPQDMDKVLSTGKGAVVVEAAYSIGNSEIDFTELPYGVMFDDVIEQIKGLSDKGELQGVIGVINDSGRDGIKLKIRLGKAANAEDVLEFLLAKTSLRMKYAINQVALVDGWPKLLSFSDMVDQYIGHNLSCVKRELEHDLEAVRARVHVLGGLASAIANIDDVVDTIRRSKDKNAAADTLSSKYGWSAAQVKAILDMKLSRLASLEGIEIQSELEEKSKQAAKLEKALGSSSEQKRMLANRLTSIMKKYGCDRRTKIQKKEARTASADVSLQRYNVELKDGLAYKSKDNGGRYDHDMLVLLGESSRVYRIAVADIPETKDAGYNLSLLVGEPVVAIDPAVVYFVTRDGKIKKMHIMKEFAGKTRNKTGFQPCKAGDGEKVLPIVCDCDNMYVCLETRDGMSIKFNCSCVPCQGKAGAGVRGIALADGDEVVNAYMTDDLTGAQNRGGKGKRL